MSRWFLFFLILIIIFLANFVYPVFDLPYFPKKDFKLGLDLQGGIHLIYEADFSQTKTEDKESTLLGLKDIMERRVNFLGVREPIVQIQGDRIIVELAGILEPEKAIEEIGKTPFLEFREEKDGEFVSTELTGKYLKRASFLLDENSLPIVSLEFDERGKEIFANLTEKNVGKVLGIFIDGKPISLPIVQEKIPSGQAKITGKFTIDEAKKLAENLNAGALPVPIKLLSWQLVGPTLGKISLEKSLWAGLFGFLTITLFLILFYHLPGFLTSLSLLFYTVFVLSVFKIISVTLTLSGIAGFLLSLGMAVDANILIFSRMKEELKSGKILKEAILGGTKRAWPAIRDGNFTTLLVCLVLIFFGTSFVRGFATTLAIGILFSMFSAILITKWLLELTSSTFLGKIKILWQ